MLLHDCDVNNYNNINDNIMGNKDNGDSNDSWVYIFSRVLRDSSPRFVGPSVRRSVTLFLFFHTMCQWVSGITHSQPT